jgi:hypothetical protein
MWNGALGRFQQGLADNAVALDTQSWGALFLLDRPSFLRRARALSALAYANATLYPVVQPSAAQPARNATGYTPYSLAFPAVWAEGSYGVALAQQRAATTGAITEAMSEDAAATIAGIAPLVREADGAVLYAAQDGAVGAGGDTFYAYPSVAATGWHVLVQAAHRHHFWNLTGLAELNGTGFPGMAPPPPRLPPPATPPHHPPPATPPCLPPPATPPCLPPPATSPSSLLAVPRLPPPAVPAPADMSPSPASPQTDGESAQPLILAAAVGGSIAALGLVAMVAWFVGESWSVQNPRSQAWQ